MSRTNWTLRIAFLLLALPPPTWAGIIFQNFEPDNGAQIVLNSVNGAQVQLVDRTEGVHFGVNAVKAVSSDYWTGFGVQAQVSGGNTDMLQTNNDCLTFWTLAFPRSNCGPNGCQQTDNNVSVTFYDQSHYRDQGFEVWTTQTARYGRWSRLKVLYSQLPPNFDFRHVIRLEFKNYWPGTYYFDDVHAVRLDRVYQAFEPEERSGSGDGEYGWKWNSNDTVAISTAGEPVYEGEHSWKLISTARWDGTGIQSQEKRYFEHPDGTFEQSFWHVDLHPENNDRLTFWVYELPLNEMDNNVGVQFYDNENHFTDDTKVEVWSKTAGTVGHWTRLTIPLSDVLKAAPDFQLHDINKIQFQFYWPGTYFLDDIRATGPQSKILESSFAQGRIQWTAVQGASNYRVQESLAGPDGPWRTIYSGSATSIATARLSKSWLHVRWEETFQDHNSLPYASGWSEVAAYRPSSVVFSYSSLAAGQLKWSAVPQTAIYEVQSAPGKYGPWSLLYRGGVTTLAAQPGIWYQVRGINDPGGNNSDLTSWSRPQIYAPGQNFVRASGTVLKDRNGNGDLVVLSGINLGGDLVIEPWMTGLGNGDHPNLPDDWSIRKAAGDRFGSGDTERLLRTYEQAYGNTFDFDRLVDQGITVVRLPFWYRNFQDDDGHWLPTAGPNRFALLDQVVNALADRGIYTLIDMHGAPGLQSNDATTGRQGFNKLFAPDGEIYRQRTEDMWRQIALHFRDNPWVMGYDLLNEPLGAAPDNDLLANMYDRLYRAIRAVDSNHLIVMEGIWYPDPTDPMKRREIVDWDTLPPPSDRRWTNVLYQFHFYHWDDVVDALGHKVKADENFISHKAFIDKKLAAAAIKQPQYNVPVMIGEFYGFNLKSIWDYYLDAFNSQNWSWTSWTYKYHDSPSTWGLVAQSGYDEDLPDFENDSYSTLTRKLSKYTTADYHTPTVTLQEIVQSKSLVLQTPPPSQPWIGSVSPVILRAGQEFAVDGWNFGASQDGSTLNYRGISVQVLSWSDRSIHAILNPFVSPGSGLVVVQTPQGASNGVDLVVQPTPPAPVLMTSQDKSFRLIGSELGDTPGTFQFYPAPCDNPLGDKPCNNGDAGIAFWSESEVDGTVPPDAADLSSRFTLHSHEGGDLYPTMLPRGSR